MQRIGILIILILSITFGARTVLAQAGGSAVPFLLIAPDARASGMGETGTAIADDINAIYWNPAGLGFLDYFEPAYGFDPDAELEPYRQVALSFSPWLPQFNADLYYSYLTVGQHFEDLDGTVAFNLILMNLGEFTATDINGREEGKFRSVEFSLGLAYGTIIAEDLSAGFQLRYIQSNLTPTTTASGDAGTGVSVSFDLGLLWKPIDFSIFEDRLSLGFNLQNIGPQMTYVRQADPLPTQLRLGAAYRAYEDEFSDLTFAFDFGKLLVKRDSLGSDPLPVSLYTGWDNPGAEISIGAEYWYQQIIALRAGYFTEPQVAGDRRFYNLGAGIKYDIFKLDFGYILTMEANHPLANTMRFSLLVDWR
ncbi:PorV/PorQ family protein [Candidatus Kapabacteria bacterium]|nr:PorV/PorQ family protein [Candidatus Kapabacteria bacterium]